MNNKVRISSSEVNFITAGIEDNVRADGRGCLEYRDIFLQAGVVPQSNGSALVKIEDTHLVVSVKVEIGEPNPNFPNRGIIQCSVDWCGDTSADSSNMEDRKELEQYGATLAKRLERALTPPSGNSKRGGIDLNSLCILPGKQCWIIYIDTLIFSDGGNLFDYISIGTWIALENTRIPTVNLTPNEHTGEMEIELSDDPMDCTKLEMSQIPICISFSKVGKKYIVDPTSEELLCMSSQLTIAIDKRGNFCEICKSGKGYLDQHGIIEILKVILTITHLRTRRRFQQFCLTEFG